MSILGSITGSIINPVNFGMLAMGPAGWAALATRAIGAAIVKEAIGMVGQQLGIPQNFISLAQNAFAAASGTAGGPLTVAGAVSQVGDAFNLTPTQQGEIQRSAQQDTRDLSEKLIESFQSGRERAESGRSRSKSNGAGSWLQRIADAMAATLDQKVEDMDRMARALDDQGSNRSMKTSTDLQVAAQEFSYLMSASSTVIKSIGEGLNGMARKQ